MKLKYLPCYELLICGPLAWMSRDDEISSVLFHSGMTLLNVGGEYDLRVADVAAKDDDVGARNVDLQARAHQPTILVVDDDDIITRILARMLRPLGQVETANCGARALEILQDRPVDVVVSDLEMPEMSGAQLLSQVAYRWPATERVLISGHIPDRQSLEGLKIGQIGCFFSKPLDTKAFQQEIGRRAQRSVERRKSGT